MAALLLVLASIMFSGLAFAQGRPVFVYPVDNQRMGDRAPWQFKVQPMANAQKFYWSVFQDGRKLWEQSIWGTKGNEFGIYPGDEIFRKIKVGRPIEVQVRAAIGGILTDPTIITVRAYDPPPSKPQPVQAAQSGRFTFTPAVSLLPLALVLFLFFPLLMYVVLSLYYRLARRGPTTPKIEKAYKVAVTKALSGLPQGLRDGLKSPAERLCLNILSYEAAIPKGRPSPTEVEVILYWLLYYWFLDRSRELQILNLLTDAKGGEATFPVPLYSLHTDVANSIQNVLNTIGQHSWDTDNYPFYGFAFNRLARTLYDNWARVSGKDGNRPEDARKKWLSPLDLQDKLSPEGLIRRYLDGTPFVDFLDGGLPVSIPHRSRFAHTHIVGGTEHGKTQLLQYLILHDLPHVAAGNRSVIVIDSQGDLINNILSLATVGAMAERVVIIDPEETASPPALNLFDFGLERVNRYSGTERENLVNSAIALCEYVFGAVMGAELTAKQGVIFSYLAHLMMVVPDATIDILIDFLEEPGLVRPHLAKLDDPISRRFFATQFFNKSFDETRQQILYRIYDVLKTRALARMFRNKRNKLDMFSAMNRGSLILIDTAKGFLKQEGCEIFGRFFIALICQAAQEREPIAQDNRRDTFVYIDEAHDYFDESIEHLLEQARKFRVGLVLAHQYLGQLKDLRATVMANTAIKLVGGLSADDAREFAKNMGRKCTPEFSDSIAFSGRQMGLVG